MAVSSYYIKPGQSPSAFAARAAALGCNVNVGDPTSGTLTLRACTNGTSLTALPAPMTGTPTATILPIWLGLR